MKLDILAFASHPDDIELGCAGTLIAHVKAGKKVGIVDLTEGELGTRGTPEGRLQEAKDAAAVMGIGIRDNLGMADGFFRNDREHQLQVIQKIRQYRPEIVIMNAVYDRHPDHGRGSDLVSESCFKAGLKMIPTTDENGKQQEAWRPKVVYHFIQDRLLVPDLVVDVTPYWAEKMQAIRAFKSQFYNPKDDSPNTYISSPEFLDFIEARAKELGHAIGVTYGEGFTKERYIGVKNLFDLI
ncbi:bacillithiol biosynthesis deacetylase BshB1 [Pontibacter ummariensis]|uniref:Bacillithiol biosynthesis deacetylase BshB1 n=1 Tax=Pontibacter ummariensis TaxID=1610492 RepID=A0A239BYI6_9BACT|nr:bacillithiol biosynthesis deacetylase BshB1 [Pontibacter ummariensis]PRY15540.1 bacillithiol biosynthesis deacetylase BshB1 [Pontibacter ummariensis]SNS13105.1 bacillithiol biosynthesis deacetylase BshB1 [Pontibacter ummariensis]